MKFVLLFIFLQASVEMGFTQQMSMDLHLRQSGKNVFLKMMDTIMMQMEMVTDSSSVESNFMRQMIPHHQGAVAMANYEIEHGKNVETIQLAKSIRTEQENEIQLMQLWLAQSADVKHPSAIQNGYRISMKKCMEEMMNDMPADAQLGDVDQAFSLFMIPHHRAAVDMARTVISYSTDQQTNLFAQHIISSQEVEIEQMMASIKK